MVTFIVGALFGAFAMDYLWARKTGVDKMVFAHLKSYFKR
jgi:hypothetical protein